MPVWAALGTMAVLAGFGQSSAQAQTLLNGAGATFPYPIYSKWFAEYKKLHSNVEINYQSVGSGAGIKQVTEGTVDFGATDGPMNDAQLKAAKDKRGGAGILHFPTVMGAAVATYNLPGVTGELSFTGGALAGIYLGKITKWNDPEIAKANPGVKLPGDTIVVVHRADSSGTSYLWTDYLSKVSPEWNSGPGKGATVKWPTGLGGKGNEGVTGLVKQTPNSIGYVELIYALENKLAFGKVKNSSGAFVKASTASVTAAAAGAATSMPDDFRVSIANAPGKDAYPISTFTWLLIPSKIEDQNKAKIIKDFLKWMLTDGQKSVEALSFAALPKSVGAKELAAIARIQ